MARRGNVKVSITADASGVQRGTRDAERSLDRLNRAGSRAFGGLKTGALAAGAAAGGGLVVGLGAATKAAIEAEKSQARLRTQLKASGISYKAHAAEIDAVIQKTSQLSGLDDEDLQDSFTNIVRVTGDVNKSLRLTGLAADFARAKHMDVAKAGEIVGKVAGGNIGILGRYGIQIDKNATSSQALAALQAKFAGQAKAYGDTTAGSIDRAKVAVENLGEQVGAKLAPAVATAATALSNFLPRALAAVGAAFNRVKAVITGFVSRNREDIQSFLAAMRNVATVVRAVIENYVIPVIRRLLPAFKAVFGGAITIIRGAVRIISGILTGDFGKAWDGVKDIFRGALRALGGLIRGFTAPFRQAGAMLGRAIMDGIKGALTAVADLGKGIANAVIGVLNSAIPNKIPIPGPIPDIDLPDNPIPRLQRGGQVPGMGRGDIIPALLEPGEFVVRRDAVDRYGRGWFEQLNAERFQFGGFTRSVLGGRRRRRRSKRAAPHRRYFSEGLQEMDMFLAMEAPLAGPRPAGASKRGGLKDAEAMGDVAGEDPAIAAQENAAAAARELAEQVRELSGQMQRQNDFATAVTSVSLGAAWQAMADLISGQIVGQGYAGRAATAGAGSAARY